MVVGDGNLDNREKGMQLLSSRSFVQGFTAVSMPRQVRVGDTDVLLVGLDPVRGQVAPEILEGRLPTTPHEVVLGPETMDRLGTGLGKPIRVEVEGQVHMMRVSGVALVGNPGLNYSAPGLDLGRGGVVTMGAVESLFGSSEAAVFLVDLAAGVDARDAVPTLQGDWGNTVLRPVRPPSVENLRRVAGLPIALAGLLGALGLIALVHALVTSVSRQRRDLAVLKTLGFVRGQVAGTVASQGTVLVLVALLMGFPLGVAGGRWGWELASRGVGTPAGPSIPLLVLLTVPLGVALANVAAAIPAGAAARLRPAHVLRNE